MMPDPFAVTSDVWNEATGSSKGRSVAWRTPVTLVVIVLIAVAAWWLHRLLEGLAFVLLILMILNAAMEPTIEVGSVGAPGVEDFGEYGCITGRLGIEFPVGTEYEIGGDVIGGVTAAYFQLRPNAEEFTTTTILNASDFVPVDSGDVSDFLQHNVEFGFDMLQADHRPSKDGLTYLVRRADAETGSGSDAADIYDYSDADFIVIDRPERRVWAMCHWRPAFD